MPLGPDSTTQEVVDFYGHDILVAMGLVLRAAIRAAAILETAAVQ